MLCCGLYVAMLLLVYDVGLWLVYGVVLLLVYGVVLLHVCVWFCVVACVWCCVVAWCVVHPASFDSWEDILFMEEILQQKTMVDIP